MLLADTMTGVAMGEHKSWPWGFEATERVNEQNEDRNGQYGGEGGWAIKMTSLEGSGMRKQMLDGHLVIKLANVYNNDKFGHMCTPLPQSR